MQYNTSTATGCNRINKKLQQKLSLRPKQKQACLVWGTNIYKQRNHSQTFQSLNLWYTQLPLYVSWISIRSTIDIIQGFHSSPHNFSMSSPQFLAFSDAAPSLHRNIPRTSWGEKLPKPNRRGVCQPAFFKVYVKLWGCSFFPGESFNMFFP